MHVKRHLVNPERTQAPAETTSTWRTILARFGVLVVMLCAAGTYTVVARAEGPAPTLASDQATYAPGDTVSLTYVRGGKTATVTVKLAARPS